MSLRVLACVRARAQVHMRVCVCVTKSVLRRNGNSILLVVEKNHRAKNLPRVKSAARPNPLPPPPPPFLPFHHTSSRLCHRRPFACIFMKSLFRTTIHRDEQRTMTASAAEMEARRWRQREGRKKKRVKNDRGAGKLVSNRGGDGSEGRRKSAYANTRHIQPLVPAVRSFGSLWWLSMKRWHIFPDFHSRGAPRLFHSCLLHTSLFPSSCRHPSPPPRYHSEHTRRLGCILDLLSVSPSLVHFLSLCRLLFFADPFRLTSSLTRKGDLYVKRVNIPLRLLQGNVRLNILFRTLNATWWCNKANSIVEVIKIKVNYI